MELSSGFSPIYRTHERAETVAKRIIATGQAPSTTFRIVKGVELYGIMWGGKSWGPVFRMPRSAKRRQTA